MCAQDMFRNDGEPSSLCLFIIFFAAIEGGGGGNYNTYVCMCDSNLDMIRSRHAAPQIYHSTTVSL